MIFLKRLAFLVALVVVLVLLKNNVILKTNVIYKGQAYSVRYLYLPDEQAKGLSDILPDQFKENEVAFFVGTKYENKYFWMPNTYFDLDIFYLDKYCVVSAINRNVPHFPNNKPVDKVPTAKPYLAFHVMEMRSDSNLAKNINIGDQLNFCSYMR